MKLHSREKPTDLAEAAISEAFSTICAKHDCREYRFRKELLVAILAGGLMKKAGKKVNAVWSDWQAKYLELSRDLTEGEEQRIISSLLANDAKWLIRLERHPHDPTKPGGLE